MVFDRVRDVTAKTKIVQMKLGNRLVREHFDANASVNLVKKMGLKTMKVSVPWPLTNSVRNGR